MIVPLGALIPPLSPLYVLFEDDGQLKAGTILADHETSLTVETVSGKRQKIKSAHALLRFSAPSPTETLARARELSDEMDPGFLWEVVPDDEFGFDELAREYYGAAPAPAQSAAAMIALARAPMYFYRKGRGRFRKAPAEALKAALASGARKEREAREIAQWVAELSAHRLPPALAKDVEALLYRPDKNAPAWKALHAACEAMRTSPVRLLHDCGAIASSHEYHFRRFVVEAFPHGIAFPAWGKLPAMPELPTANVEAFSIDDASTTEIDDAFSVRARGDGTVEIGIHIACPALAMARGSPLDAIARQRLSTVYMPGRKITMLPDDVIAAFTLAATHSPPALSLYVVTDAEGTPLQHRTALERVPITANLRPDALSEAFADDPASAEPRWTAELRALWKLATRLGEARGKPDEPRIDYSFDVDWSSSANGEPGRVAIVPRPRGNPLDRLVSELMIHVNYRWGRTLAEAGVPGLYRVQSGGKVKMSTRPGEHQGLGLTHYLWGSSPLRRYSDLVNQRQLLAAVRGERAPYADNDADLFAALADFEATYAQYAAMQERMEHYWCLRFLHDERVGECTSFVLRDTLVRFERLPLVLRPAGMPAAAPGTRVKIAIGRIDLFECALECRYAGAVTPAPASPDEFARTGIENSPGA